MQVPGRLKPLTLESWAEESLARGNEQAVVSKVLSLGGPGWKTRGAGWSSGG